MRAPKITEPVRKSICLSVKDGLDAEQVREEWQSALRFLTDPGFLRLTVSREQRGAPEIRLDWNAVPSEIAQYTSFLQTREEYGGGTAYLDVYEAERRSASHQHLEQLREDRRLRQAEAESDAKVALLQPRVCSLEGLFEAAELGNVEVIKAMIRGYPLPTYDSNTGTFRPNMDRTAVPQQKHVLRETKQLSHTSSARQYSTSGCQVAGDAMDDLRQSAPHLFDAQGKLASTYDLRDAYGKTPVHIAAASGQHLAIALLLEEGCDANAKDRVGQTPLHLACLGGHRDAVRSLLKSGARVDEVANDGRGLMHFVAVGAQKKLCEWLLLDPEVQAHKAHKELEKVTLGDAETVLHALAKCDASSKEKRQNVVDTAKTILKCWSFLNNRPVAELLEARDHCGQTALHGCARSDSFELMRYLVSCGASPNVQTSSGDVPLHISVRISGVAACNFLISAGTDLTMVNSDGDTPLHLAAAVGSMEVFKMCFQASPGGLVPPVIERCNNMGDR